MTHRIRRTALAGVATVVAVAAIGAPSASAETILHQIGCDGNEPSALFALAPVECGIYNPETESYDPYDPAKDTSGPLGLGIFGI